MPDDLNSLAGNAFTDIDFDFDRKGRQLGFVNIPHSPHDDAWGVTQVPIAVLANGTGPTVVMEGATTATNMKAPSSSASWRATSIPAPYRGA